MGRAVLGAFVLLGCLVVASCGGTLASPFAIELPAATTDAEPLPISLIDQTGQVAGVTGAPAGAATSQVDAVEGRPTVLRVSWPGGRCDDRATLVLNVNGTGYELAIHNHAPITAGLQCDGETAARAVDITFRVAIEPSQLLLSITYP